ncbi:MAG: phosphopentomutase [Clostridia bacterium]|nr:phosphopentomutase [Clostridia bacterium]
MKRVFLIVLDSCGCGEMPDAPKFGDHGVNTLKRISADPRFYAETTKKMGLGLIPGLEFIGSDAAPTAAVGRMTEASMGKDTTIGHWEIAGVVSPRPLPTYPDGFPEEVLEAFRKATGRGVLCNKPYSGTQVLKDYGEEHLKTGDLIVYTSADSVFQIAAHEELVPPELLYEYCRMAREILQGEHGVGRVIARPFLGENADNFYRTPRRHDFSLLPPKETVLDAVKNAGKTVYAIGKISDIFAGQGVTEKVYTQSNEEGMALTLEALDKDFEGLCFTNLVDFDMKYGHRRDIPGYAEAYAVFDRWLPGFMEKMRDGDILMITADHGCDPGYLETTDHTREYTPLIVYGKGVEPYCFGTRPTFADIAATVADWLGVPFECPGESLIGGTVRTETILTQLAIGAMKNAYVPYSGYKVGAALLCADGTVFTGCNIENASYTPTVCAERTAIFKAVSEGRRDFKMLAVAGGKDGRVEGLFPPCGVCRQVIAEFCGPDFPVLVATGMGGYKKFRFSELLPNGFSPAYMDI